MKTRNQAYIALLLILLNFIFFAGALLAKSFWAFFNIFAILGLTLSFKKEIQQTFFSKGYDANLKKEGKEK